MGVVYFRGNSSTPNNEIANGNVPNETPVIENNYVEIYTENAEQNENVENNNPEQDDSKEQEEIVVDEKTEKELTFIALGEIMMGGFDGTSYALPFMNVSDIAKDADYTLASLATNIIDLDEIENPTSKYIVTKDITRAFTALGLDGINVATDHMMDFSNKVFEETKDILKDSDKDIIGLQDDIIYAEKDGIKVAFIGVCNEVIGSYSKYVEAGISMYDDYMIKIKANIAKAKQNANTVVMITHLGPENTHKVTDVMTWFYKELINAGADMVLGNHALGVYPIEMYKGKPIIYSLGYLFSDTEYETGKKSGIFKFTVNVDGEITKLEVTPTYINDDEVLLYSEYNLEDATEFLKYISQDAEDYELKTSIENNKLVIEFY